MVLNRVRSLEKNQFSIPTQPSINKNELYLKTNSCLKLNTESETFSKGSILKSSC